MDTDQLIRTLAQDNAHRARPVGFALMLALMAAAPVSLLMFFTELGFRPDIRTAMHNPFFDLKFAVTLALAIAVDSTSIKETAAKFAMSEGAVRVALHRGLTALTAKLREQ